MKYLLFCSLTLYIVFGQLTKEDITRINKQIKERESKITIGILGDSNTAHGEYAKELQRLLGNKYLIETHATNGAGVSWCADKLNCEVITYDYKYIIIFCGVNDIDGQFFRTSHIIDMLTLMYKKCWAKGMKVIAITLTPWKGYKKNYFKPEKIMTYAVNGFILSKPKYVDIVINAYDIFENKEKPGYMKEEYTTDGLHLNNVGHKLLGRLIYNAITNKR